MLSTKKAEAVGQQLYLKRLRLKCYPINYAKNIVRTTWLSNTFELLFLKKLKVVFRLLYIDFLEWITISQLLWPLTLDEWK